MTDDPDSGKRDPEEHPNRYIPSDFKGVSASEGAPPVETRHLEEAIRSALSADRRVNAHLVEIRITDGSVVLSGRQDTVQARDAVTEVTRRVPGVAEVINNLEIRPSV